MNHKTPCEELGYEVGDRFIVNDGGYGFADNSMIELEHDDRTNVPLFALIEGSCRYNHSNLMQYGAYTKLECVTKLQEEKPINKIGELITDWESLEVGDKAVFEGYNTDCRLWDYTLGCDYTVLCDPVGGIGFPEDETSGCPRSNLKRFNFRLISKASGSTSPSTDTQEGEWIDTRGFTSEQVLAAAEWMSERHGVPIGNLAIYQDDEQTFTDYLCLDSGNVYSWTFDPRELDADYNFKVQVVPTFKTTMSVDSFEIIQNKSEKELQLESEIATLTTQAEQQKQAVAESLKLIEEAKSKLTK